MRKNNNIQTKETEKLLLEFDSIVSSNNEKLLTNWLNKNKKILATWGYERIWSKKISEGSPDLISRCAENRDFQAIHTLLAHGAPFHKEWFESDTFITQIGNNSISWGGLFYLKSNQSIN